MKAKVRKVISFLTTDIWRIRLRDLPRLRSWPLKQLRTVILAFRGFSTDKCSLRASALTFFTILAMVPAVAVAFAIGREFGPEKVLEERLTAALQGHEEIAARIIVFSHSLLDSAKGSLLASVGLVLVLWTLIKVLSQIENSFNDIWGIKTPRSLGRKFADYLSVMLICPILVVVSGSATVVAAGKVQAAIQAVPFF